MGAGFSMLKPEIKPTNELDVVISPQKPNDFQSVDGQIAQRLLERPDRDGTV